LEKVLLLFPDMCSNSQLLPIVRSSLETFTIILGDHFLKNLISILVSVSVITAGAASASTLITVTLGDSDCFGQGGTCPGVQTAPEFGFDNLAPGDPAGTDIFGEIGTVSLSFALDLTGATVSDAKVSARVWGLDLFADPPGTPGSFGDEFVGARFQVNGADVGTYFSPNTADGNGPNRIETVMFDFTSSLLVTGTNTVTIIPEQDFLKFASTVFSGKDSYAVDFAQVSFTTDPIVTPPSAVPLPAGLPLLLGALGLLGLARRTRG
jgi:hypothetical protein